MRHHRTVLSLIVAVVVTVALATLSVAAGASTRAATGKATEIGVTAKEVRIAVVADVDNALAPGVFKGVVDGAQAAAKYVNASGGVAGGRKLVVDFIDSHLNPAQARNAIITACGQDVAMVGTAIALFSGLEDMTGCKDQAGAATGLPDIGAIVLGTPQACAAVSFPVTQSAIDCSTVGKVPQTYRVQQGQYSYFVSKTPKLSGPVIRPSDSPDAMRAMDANIAAAKHVGIDVTDTPSQSNRDPQSAYTAIINQMKQDGSNFSDNGMAAPGAILIRQEAALQGLTDPKIVWSCTSACYDQKAMAAAGSAMDGEYTPLGFLPFEEAKTNKTLAAFVKYVGKDNLSAFAVYGWEAVLAFRETADTAAKGASGLTRTSLLDALRNLHSFDAGGMAGTVDIGNKVPSACLVLMQWKSGAFHRVTPSKAGTFDCNPKNRYTFQADLTTP
ncbi:MAG: ABC transporter substrate-binding protein [Acidimicrobiia bacterium]